MGLSALAARDGFGRSVGDGWGSADRGGAYTLTGTASDFDVNGSAGTVVVPAAATNRDADLQDLSLLHADIRVRAKTDKVAAGNVLQVIVVARQSASSSHFLIVQFNADQTITLRLRRFLGSVTELALTPLFGVTHAADTYYRIRFQVLGTGLRAKVWADGAAEPADWQITATDDALPAGYVRVRSRAEGGVSNTPVLFTYDDLEVMGWGSADRPIMHDLGG